MIPLSDIPEYEGHPVTETKVILRKTGDGLSNPVAVDQLVVELGEEGFLASRFVGVKHQYETNRDDQGKIVSVTLVQVLESTGAAFADKKLIGVAIQRNVDAIAEEQARKKGQLTLSLVEDEGDGNVTNIDKLPRANKARGAHKEIADKVDDAFDKGKTK